MLIPEFVLFELRLIFVVVDLLEDVLEAAIILLQDGVFGRQKEWILTVDCVVEALVRKFGD